MSYANIEAFKYSKIKPPKYTFWQLILDSTLNVSLLQCVAFGMSEAVHDEALALTWLLRMEN